jgi:hypothetical protein
VDSDCGGLNECALLEAHVLRKLVAVVFGKRIVPREGSIVRRCSSESHIWAKVVLSLFASYTATARDTGLHCDAVTDLQRLDLVANRVYNSSGFMAKNHGRLDDEVSDTALNPVVHI